MRKQVNINIIKTKIASDLALLMDVTPALVMLESCGCSNFPPLFLGLIAATILLNFDTDNFLILRFIIIATIFETV